MASRRAAPGSCRRIDAAPGRYHRAPDRLPAKIGRVNAVLFHLGGLLRPPHTGVSLGVTASCATSSQRSAPSLAASCSPWSGNWLDDIVLRRRRCRNRLTFDMRAPDPCAAALRCKATGSLVLRPRGHVIRAPRALLDSAAPHQATFQPLPCIVPTTHPTRSGAGKTVHDRRGGAVLSSSSAQSSTPGTGIRNFAKS